MAGSFAFYFAVDTLFKRGVGWFPDDPNGRYLTLHVLCNGFVTLVHFDDVVCIDWAADSETFITGSRDLTAKIYSLDTMPGFPVNLAGHKDVVVGAFLGEDGVAYTVARDGCCVGWMERLCGTVAAVGARC